MRSLQRAPPTTPRCRADGSEPRRRRLRCCACPTDMRLAAAADAAAGASCRTRASSSMPGVRLGATQPRAAVGTVAHRILAQIAREGLAAWTRARRPREHAADSRRARGRGASTAPEARAAERVAAGDRRMLADQRGRWLFDPAHATRQRMGAGGRRRRARSRTSSSIARSSRTACAGSSISRRRARRRRRRRVSRPRSRALSRAARALRARSCARWMRGRSGSALYFPLVAAAGAWPTPAERHRRAQHWRNRRIR